MADLEQLNRQKEKILSSLRMRGPSLPVQIAKILETSPLFASAFLSELKADNKLEISNMRVGSSPLYYLPGQENLLENFVRYLNQREREAFVLLKERLILEDDKQTPVVRVALRAIKDFAVPLNVRVGGEPKLFWKYFLLSDEKAVEILSQVDRQSVSEVKEKMAGQIEKKEIEEVQEVAEEKSVGREGVFEKEAEGEVAAEIVPEVRAARNVGKKKVQESEFANSVREVLGAKEIEVLESFVEKKKEFEARVRIDMAFGKQEFYMIAKDKKSATDNDLVVAWQKAQSLKLPALVMCTGELNKKAKEHLRDWGNLVKFEKLKF